jgi:hypothetical protein
VPREKGFKLPAKRLARVTIMTRSEPLSTKKTQQFQIFSDVALLQEKTYCWREPCSGKA